METEPLLGLSYVRRESYASTPTPTSADRRGSTDSTVSTSSHSSVWGWREDDEPEPPQYEAPATVASSSAPKPKKGMKALVHVKWGKGERKPPEREWNRPEIAWDYMVGY